MKSGPHLNGCTVSPRFRSATIRESVTVVLPAPLAGPAITKPFVEPDFVRMARSLAIFLSPMLKEDHLLEWDSRQPSGNLQFRPRKKFAYISQTQISDRNYVLGNLQQPPEFGRLENAHPSHTDAFAACRQPQILNGAASAVDIGFANGVSSQDVRPVPRRIARDAQIHRRFQNPFELQLRIELAFFPFEYFRGRCIGLLE